MKNYLKMTFFVVFTLLLSYTTNVSAAHPYNTYTYTDRLVYTEDHTGDDQGFSVDFNNNQRSSVRGYTYCDIYDFSYGGKKCARYGNRPYYQAQDYYGYDHDQALREAFRTYRESSRYEYQLERLRIQEQSKKDMVRYGGYGSGYSGHRYYSYG